VDDGAADASGASTLLVPVVSRTDGVDATGPEVVAADGVEAVNADTAGR